MGFAWNYTVNLAAAMTGRQPSRPLLFSYYVTHRCDLNCHYCSDGNGKRFSDVPSEELGLDEARKLISILARSSDTLDITGGEPMMRRDLEEIMAHARQEGMQVVLNTKSHGLKDRPDLVRLSDVLVISVDSLDVSKLAGIQGIPANFAARTLEALDFVLAELPLAGTKIVLSAVACPDNLTDVGDVLKFASKHGLGFHVSPQIVGTQVHARLLSNPDYVKLIVNIETEKSKGTVLGVPEYLSGIREFRPYKCYPLLMPAIRPDGHMYYPCLESGRAMVSVLEEGSYERALRKAEAMEGKIGQCGEKCHIFCHMGLSLLQSHPLSALMEGVYWQRLKVSAKMSESCRGDESCSTK